MGTQQTVLITGARGFVGSHLAKTFTEREFSVRSLVRNIDQAKELFVNSNGGVFKGVLPDEIDPLAFQGNVRAVIHCAYETRTSNLALAHAVNQVGTQKILHLTRQNNIPQFIFISSMASHEEAQSYYGKSKWEIEQTLDLSHDLVIKPGTVLGMGGIFGRTREMIRKLPILPVFFGKDKRMQTVWIDDLCEGIFQAVTKNLTGSFCIAEPEGVLIPEFYRGIAALDGKFPLLVPFPGELTLYALKLFEAMGLTLPITSENLLGIKFLKKFEVESSCTALGIRVRNFEESLKTIALIEQKNIKS